MEKAKERKKIDFSTYGLVVGFLCLEILAFVSFYLGHSFLLYGILSIVLAGLLLLVTFRQIKKDGITSFLFFLFPIFVFALLTALSGFGTKSIGAISVVETVFVPIGLTLFGLSGFLSAYIEKFKIKLALLIIYSALGLFVFINLLITMIYYVPFYTLIYKNSYIVYNGQPSALPIGSMAYMLFGFQVKEVSVNYWSLFPSIGMTTIIPLFFIKFKENKRDFLIYCAISFVCFLSLLFTISTYSLISDLVLILGIAIIVIAAKIHKARPVLDGMMIAIGIIFGLLVIVMFINAQTNWGFVSGFRNMIAKTSLLNRLFNTNRFASSINVVFQDMFTQMKFFGVPVGGYGYQYDNGVAQELCNMWIFDNAMTSGVFGSLFFIAAIVLGVIKLFKYLKYSEEEGLVKFTIAGYVLGFFVISLFLQDTRPLVNSSLLSPFYTSAPLLISLFLLGYVYNKTLSLNIKKEESSKEETSNENNNKEEIEDETIAL